LLFNVCGYLHEVLMDEKVEEEINDSLRFV